MDTRQQMKNVETRNNETRNNVYSYRQEEVKGIKMNILTVCCRWTDRKLWTFCWVRSEWDL